MARKAVRSVEPNIADMVNGWLKSYGLDYKLEQESLTPDIDKALDNYFSKNGGTGGNRPDAKILLQDDYGSQYPVLLEYKGHKEKLVKLDDNGVVANKTAQNTPKFSNINSYAVNGAVHYANAILHYTSYEDVIAIGVTGYKDDQGDLKHMIGVYIVSKSNLGAGQKIDEYSDLSFLRPENFNIFIQKVKLLRLSQEELDRLKELREHEIDASLIKLNNEIFQNERALQEKDRVYLVASTIIATLGIPNKVTPLEKEDLKSSSEPQNRDGDILIRKITAFLNEKHIPDSKRDIIVRTLSSTLLTDSINKSVDGESQLKRIFTKIVDDLGIYYKIGLTTDFTGKLFNEMYNWLGFTQDKLNDVVLTPSYVATLLVKLARVNMDSYVWDFATGSAGLLVAAMNEMCLDAKNKMKSPDKLDQKIARIKSNQLLGVEILSDIYILAVLNMILMGDGTSNILNEDSLDSFDGTYCPNGTPEKFPATAFVLNPPYSAEGNGMIFVQKALSMMDRGYAAIIIQSSTGSGKAIEFNKEILKSNTLIASIKMPIDLFIGRSSVQTYIYVFRVGEAHQMDDIVKFIDFSNDGYSRSNRRRAVINLRDTDHAKERYQEVVDLVRFGREKLNLLTENEYYEGHIDPENGADWNQSAPSDTRPTLEAFKDTVADYLAWDTSQVLKKLQDSLVNTPLSTDLDSIEWSEYRLGDLFEVKSSAKKFDANKTHILDCGEYPYIVRKDSNNGQRGFLCEDERYLNPGNTFSFGQDTATIFYQKRPYFTGDKIKILVPKFSCLNEINAQFFLVVLRVAFSNFSWGGSSFQASILENQKIYLPTKENVVDYTSMERIIAAIQGVLLQNLTEYISKK